MNRSDVIAQIEAELSRAAENWKAIGYWCPECMRRKPEGGP